MRKIMYFFFVGLSTFFGAAAFAGTAPLAGQCIDDKFYVELGTVHVAPSGIFLNLEGTFIPVEAVCMDGSGIYVLGYEAKRMVYCPKCGRTYNADRFSSKCPHTDEWCRYPS